MTLGSHRLKTWLLLVMRNGSTGSTRPITNHPEARYNRQPDDDPPLPANLDLPLWQLIRASAAAPAYFPTELVRLSSRSGEERLYEFVDGGISPYNNPALAMYLAATLEPYGMNMPTGRQELFLCSVGSGALPSRFEPGKLGEINVIGGALRSLRGLIESVADEQDKLCRVFGHCVHGHVIDRELGDLVGEGMGLFTYCRYQHEFTGSEIAACRAKTGSRNPFALDDIASVPALLSAGREYASSVVDPSHFPE